MRGTGNPNSLGGVTAVTEGTENNPPADLALSRKGSPRQWGQETSSLKTGIRHQRVSLLECRHDGSRSL